MAFFSACVSTNSFYTIIAIVFSSSSFEARFDHVLLRAAQFARFARNSLHLSRIDTCSLHHGHQFVNATPIELSQCGCVLLTTANGAARLPVIVRTNFTITI
jgi:hypothetical protein